MPNRRLPAMTALDTARFSWRWLVLLGLLCSPAHAEYVTDKLRVEIRSGPTTGHRIVTYLTGGTPFEVVSTGEGFTQLRTANGVEGWIANDYVSAEPGARSLLREAEAKIEKLQANLEEATAGSGNVFKELETAQATIASMTTALDETRSELARVKAVSTGAVAAAERLQSLEELNARLRTELRDLAADRERLAANLEERWLLIGAGLLFGGLLLGVIIKARPRRSAWS